MTGNHRKERASLNRLAEAFVDDILNTSDEDILAEFQETHGDPDRNAAELRELFEQSVLLGNKRRLTAARAGAAAARRASSVAASLPVDIAVARARLRALIDAPGMPQQVTLAARKESELSDADILGVYEDLLDLGIVSLDNDQRGKA